MALGTIDTTPETATSSAPIQTPHTQDHYLPAQEPPLPDWEAERRNNALLPPEQWETGKESVMQPPAIEAVDHTKSIDQLSELVRLQIVDTNIEQLMIQLELLEMVERLQSALIQQIPQAQGSQPQSTN